MSKIVIYVRGGMIQGIDSDIEDVRVLILDEDINDMDKKDEHIQTVDRGDGSFDAYVYEEVPALEPKIVEAVWEQVCL